jgi:hypothetical protein
MRNGLKTAMLLTILGLVGVVPASAQRGGVGNSPYAAQLLISGLNTGSLAPKEEFWYAYSRGDLSLPDAGSIILDLNFKPGGQRTAKQVTFQVFTFDQVIAHLESASQASPNAGEGVLAAADYDNVSSERLWSGPLTANELYYVKLVNNSDLTVDYRLTAILQRQVMARNATSGALQASTQPSASRSVGLTLPTNLPGSQRWLLAAQAIHGLPAEEAAAWLLQASSLGWLPTGPAAEPAPAQANTSTAAPPLTQPAIPQPADLIPPRKPDNSIYPNNPLTMRDVNEGRLAPGSEHWYHFRKSDLDQEAIEEMAITMFHTPGEGNVANRVNFELFTGSSFQIWKRGTPDDMVNFGAGQLVSRDGDDRTGERLWRGTVVDGDLYYVKIKNDANTWIDYHLITGDIINAELGQPTVVTRPPVPAAPTGEDISTPLNVRRGHTTGHLEAGEDVWYKFEHLNLAPDKFDYRHYTMVLEQQPGSGNVANRVDVEIYPYPSLELWQRGDEHLMTPMGTGLREAYDRDTGIQRRTWDGFLVANTIYFVRVRNDSAADIQFDLEIQRR